MKKFRVLGMMVGVLSAIVMNVAPVMATTQDFYFTQGEFDYYLSKNEDGSSHMVVTEVLSAVFPTANQNHGIERCLPIYYRGVKTLDEESLIVFRNGEPETYMMEMENHQLCLRIGEASTYMHGAQTYRITYKLNNVIFDPDNAAGQELYWDANGTGWLQTFNKVTATVHLSDEIAQDFSGDISCYVGLYGTAGSGATSRCEKCSDDDTVSFTAYAVGPGETLTFDLGFKVGAFVIMGAEPNYALFIVLGLMAVCWVVGVILVVKMRGALREKISLAKEKANPVQYVPPKNLTVAEAGTVYLKNKRSLYVATVMELAVRHKIELERGAKKFGGYEWRIHVKETAGMSRDEEIALEVLNGGDNVTEGTVIEIQKSRRNSKVVKLGEEFKETLEKELRKQGLYEKKGAKSPAQKYAIILGVTMFVYILLAMGALGLADAENAAPLSDGAYGAVMMAVITSGVLYTIMTIMAVAWENTYARVTMEGVRASRYLDGLKEYMQLAEKERLEFLHSVEGADVSPSGIVKLYEKLLPYAVLFGIEKSWLSELNKYYEMEEVGAPDWMMGAILFSYADLKDFSGNTSAAVASSIGASGDSSGYSGGGGGGFSGGGGGGGGGGGW